MADLIRCPDCNLVTSLSGHAKGCRSEEGRKQDADRRKKLGDHLTKALRSRGKP